MQPRSANTITEIVANAQQKLREIKEVQLFGGDALNLKEFRQIFTMPGGITKDYCWRVVMTPTEPEFTMPIDTVTKPNAPNQFGYMKVERVPTTDGTFEWLVFGQQFDFDPNQDTLFRVTYSGAATFQVTNLA